MTETTNRAKEVLKYPRKVRSRAGEENSKQDYGRPFRKAVVDSSLLID